jgi:hypothetical protein
MAHVTRRKVKRTIGLGGGAGDVNGMFEKMMGVKDADKDIVIPKLVLVRNKVRHVYGVLTTLAKILKKDFPKFSNGLEDIETFCAKLHEAVVFDKDADDTEESYTKVDQVKVNALYKKLKSNDYVRTLAGVFGKLKEHEMYLKDKGSLQDNFINLEPGLSFKIFSFSNLDLKLLWVDDGAKASVKSFVLNVLHLILVDTRVIIETITSPDVDIKQFSEVLVSSIGELRKRPGLDRCGDAFKRIEDSVGLLKGNFGTYYRDSMASNNPNTMVESFIMDVSNQGKANANLTRQFRVIISHMRGAVQKKGGKMDPAVQKIFAMLNGNVKKMPGGAETKDDLEDLGLGSKGDGKGDKKEFDPEQAKEAKEETPVTLWTPSVKSQAVKAKKKKSNTKKKKKKPSPPSPQSPDISGDAMGSFTLAQGGTKTPMPPLVAVGGSHTGCVQV